MKTIVVEVDKCTGCRLCELACSFKKTGEFNPIKSRIQVVDFDEIFCLPVTCFQCEKPYCGEVCPAGAIVKEESGAVTVMKEKCVGCKMCTLACPFGCIVFSSTERVAVKCDLCQGEPECVLFCPTGALTFRETDVAAMGKKSALAKKLHNIKESVEYEL